VVLAVAVRSSTIIYSCEDSIDCFGCFIALDEPGWRVAAFYFPLWSSWLFVIALYLLTFRRLKALDQFSYPDWVRNFRRRLVLIPLVYILIRTPETIFRIYEWHLQYTENLDINTLQPDALITTINIIQAFVNPSQGFWNFLLFALGSNKGNRLASTCWCYVCCWHCFKWQEETQPPSLSSRLVPVVGSTNRDYGEESGFLETSRSSWTSDRNNSKAMENF